MKKMILAITIIAVLAVSFFYLNMQSNPGFGPLDLMAGENFSIPKVFSNDTQNAFFVEVTAVSQDITVQRVTIEDTHGKFVTYSNEMSDKIIKGEIKTLKVTPQETTSRWKLYCNSPNN